MTRQPATPLARNRRSDPRAARLALLAALSILGATQAQAFCGFYVAKADADLWNEASQVALVRDGERTVMTMSNDYRGELKDFALVVPVPVVLKKEQIHVGSPKLIQRLDAFSAARLVEYHDDDPCRPVMVLETMGAMDAVPSSAPLVDARAKALGVKILESYTVGEYDIVVLSAEQSDGLETWLKENGYRMPAGASRALAPYVRQGLKFFVAKVNLEEQAKTGYRYLRPLQMAFETPRFMLPIRLGMLNAKGAQDLLVYVLTRGGRVETANYRTVKIPSDMDIPTYVKTEFADFYRAMFARAWEKEGKDAVFLEYFWDMAWCDPCAADPLTPDELREIGVFWLDGGARKGMPGGPANVLLTRLHVRYDAEHFPEDLVFQETKDRDNFQGRYVLRHPFAGTMTCDAGRDYARQVSERRDKEAETLASLTGWPIDDIRRKMGPSPVQAPREPQVEATPTPLPLPAPPESWWQRIWK